jgi:multidrug resistance protein MdtO
VSILRLGTGLLTSIDCSDPREDTLRHADILRDQLGKTVAGVRSMNGSVPYEFGADRERQILTGDMIMRATLTCGALFWNQLAVLHNEADSDYLTDPSLRDMRHKIAEHMSTLANAVECNIVIPIEPVATFIDPTLFADPRHGEYARNTAARYEELQNLTAILSHQV